MKITALTCSSQVKPSAELLTIRKKLVKRYSRIPQIHVGPCQHDYKNKSRQEKKRKIEFLNCGHKTPNMVGTSPSATVDDLPVILDSETTRQMVFSHTGEVQRSLICAQSTVEHDALLVTSRQISSITTVHPPSAHLMLEIVIDNCSFLQPKPNRHTGFNTVSDPYSKTLWILETYLDCSQIFV